MSIDAQRMFRVLEQACCKAGVEILQGWVETNLAAQNIQVTPQTVRNVDKRSESFGWFFIAKLADLPVLGDDHRSVRMILSPSLHMLTGTGRKKESPWLHLGNLCTRSHLFIIRKKHLDRCATACCVLEICRHNVRDPLKPTVTYIVSSDRRSGKGYFDILGKNKNGWSLRDLFGQASLGTHS